VPELPEVETVVREVRPHLQGRTIAAVRVGKHPLRRPWSQAWNKALLGQTIRTVERRGKWIFATLGSGRILVIHLGMTGQLTMVPAAAPRESHTHVVFALQDSDAELRFRDIRRFGSVSLLPADWTIESHLEEIGLGPEPFGADLDYWRSQLARTRRNLKAVLLDQHVVAGVGNIYADESLFAARLYPARLADTLTAREVRRLAAAVPMVLNCAIDKRGSSIRNYVGGSGLKGGYQDEFRVYGRTGLPCLKCGKEIRHMRLAGRSTHWCPGCQKG
jgi:formamidopyrimidine-DNA glycosylase